MAAAPRWRRRREERPSELLEHALTCFAEQGVDATTLEEIARRAGVTKGTIYHYFASKEALFDRLVEEIGLPALATLSATAAGGGTQVERLEAVMHRHWHLLTTTPVRWIPRLVVGEIHRRPDLVSRLMDAVGRHILGIYVDVIASGCDSGAFRTVDPRLASQQIVLPMLARTLFAGSPLADGMLGSPDAFIESHCQAIRRWLGPTVEPP